MLILISVVITLSLSFFLSTRREDVFLKSNKGGWGPRLSRRSYLVFTPSLSSRPSFPKIKNQTNSLSLSLSLSLFLHRGATPGARRALPFQLRSSRALRAALPISTRRRRRKTPKRSTREAGARPGRRGPNPAVRLCPSSKRRSGTEREKPALAPRAARKALGALPTGVTGSAVRLGRGALGGRCGDAGAGGVAERG